MVILKMADFSSETMEDKDGIKTFLKCWKKKSPTQIIPTIASEIILSEWRWNKKFSDKIKLWELMVRTPSAQNKLMEVFRIKENDTSGKFKSLGLNKIINVAQT